MNLTKWQTNSEHLRLKWNCNLDETSLVPKDNCLQSKILGINWIPKEDVFSFNVQNLIDFVKTTKGTKRDVLRSAARLFDPLGFLSPFTIQVKILFQNLWEKGRKWDELLAEDEKFVWNSWVANLSMLSSIKIPRCIELNGYTSKQVHIFCDASEKAYGAVAYTRLILNNDTVRLSLTISKARVAPLKKLTLPRLELMGTLIGARLAYHLRNVITDASFYFWIDSMIALSWIRGSAKKWKPFVANRVTEIQELSNPSNWSYCEGLYNPADKLTRGMTMTQLLDEEIWWKGPNWLFLREELWPKPKYDEVCLENEK
ncbi:hypothetical protein B4U79_09153, partial [Dinothrombium tinctorium]